MNKKLILALAASLIVTVSRAQAPEYRNAVDLYEHGMYSEASRLFGTMEGDGPEGYVALCAIALHEKGYEERAAAFLERWPESLLVPRVNFEWAKDLFDREAYEEASRRFSSISQADLMKEQLPEFCYKRAYSALGAGDVARARTLFENMQSLPHSDYTAPAQYSLGYSCYTEGDFREAAEWFGKAARDARFEQLANYYILECRFMEKDYRYVVRHGEDMFNKVPADRQPHLARIMSESYLVLGDTEKARTYYQKNLEDKAEKTRSDYFHAGSVLYAVKDWQGAVDNFSKMTDPTDSLGQVSRYQMGYSYVQLRNKVAAMEAFKEASELRFDPEIQEDAYFNYAKLAFDLNNDVSAFNDYLSRYNAYSKGDGIYSYMAMAALANHDYEAAVAAYDHIDELDPRMQSNYMKAYFLRAEQLISSGAYRDAVPHLKAAAYYSSRHDPFNQLSRYWLAESYFRDGKYPEARDVLTDLYNLSALDGKPEGDLISYNMAYTYFREGEYASALKWFNNYLDGRHDAYGADAETRIGDCYFFTRDYKTAIAAFERKLSDYPDADDIYPYYRAGVASGLAGDFAGKVRFLERVKQASPSSPYYSEAMYELGRAYVSTGDDDDAVRTFRTLRSNTEDRNFATRALLELAMISRNKGDDERALGYYKQVVEQGTDYTEDALLAIESIYRTRQEPDAYLAYLNSLGDKASRTEEQKGESYFGTAEQIFLSGNWSKAVATLQSYLEKYPEGAERAKAEFYLAESYRMEGDKDRACDHYVAALDKGLDGSFEEQAWLRYADLTYSMERFSEAYGAYRELGAKARMDENRRTAATGMMRAAYRGRAYAEAIQAAEALKPGAAAGSALAREADYVRAKSYLATSQRSRAYEIFKTLSSQPSTDEGAEAAYLVIQDMYDRASFAGIEDKVYDFAGKAEGQNYWLAKAFIVLGDTFAENGNMAQAKATFESIRNGYTPSGADDDVLDQVQLRLNKLSK